MKTWKIITITGVALIAAALVTATAFACINGQGFYSPYTTTPSTGAYTGYSNGMMGGYSYQYGAQTTYPSQYYGGMGCRGWTTYPSTIAPTTSTPIAIDTAVGIAQNYVASLSNKDLTIDEVEEYTQNFYVLVKENSTGRGAFELLIDKYTGSIGPEQGPNMMWNTKYSVMSGSGMMGWITGSKAAPMTVTADQAKADAQQYLNAYYPGTTVGDIDAFYGYYHLDVQLAGQTYGMLSVNGYTGQVWYHTWHGAFIQAVIL
jgi:hypothetical protein